MIEELDGGEKSQESVLGLFRARKYLQRRFGSVHVSFGEPVSLAGALGSSASLLKRWPVARSTACKNEKRFSSRSASSSSPSVTPSWSASAGRWLRTRLPSLPSFCSDRRIRVCCGRSMVTRMRGVAGTSATSRRATHARVRTRSWLGASGVDGFSRAQRFDRGPRGSARRHLAFRRESPPGSRHLSQLDRPIFS